MSALLTIVPVAYRWLALVLLSVALVAFGAFKGDQHRGRVDDIEMQRMRNEWSAERAAQANVVRVQRDRNVEIQRAAEKNYVVTLDKQGSFFAAAAKEIHDADAPLADCRVPDAVRVRLNAAAACARGDSPAACGPAGPVPLAGGPS